VVGRPVSRECGVAGAVFEMLLVAHELEADWAGDHIWIVGLFDVGRNVDREDLSDRMER
jgi:hypothetical protein